MVAPLRVAVTVTSATATAALIDTSRSSSVLERGTSLAATAIHRNAFSTVVPDGSRRDGPLDCSRDMRGVFNVFVACIAFVVYVYLRANHGATLVNPESCLSNSVHICIQNNGAALRAV